MYGPDTNLSPEDKAANNREKKNLCLNLMLVEELLSPWAGNGAPATNGLSCYND